MSAECNVILDEEIVETFSDHASEVAARYHTYLFVDVKTNNNFTFEQVVFDESVIATGELIVVNDAKEKHKYFSVQSIDDAKGRVYLTTPSNAYGKIVLLFSLLGGIWLLLDYIMEKLF